MKYIISSILFALVLTTGLFAQQNIINEQHQRIISHVEGNIYDVQFLNSNGLLVQEGQYWRDGNSLKPHGQWKLFAYKSSNVVTKATYDKGEQISVETIIDGRIVKAQLQYLAKKSN